MAQVRSGRPSKRLVWRITPEAPRGEYVAATAAPKARCEPANGDESGWVLSSFDLLTGLDVIEGDGLAPLHLFNEVFTKPAK